MGNKLASTTSAPAENEQTEHVRLPEGESAAAAVLSDSDVTICTVRDKKVLSVFAPKHYRQLLNEHDDEDEGERTCCSLA